MDLIDVQKFTVVQLKRWLAALNLPTIGNKAELAARLNGVDPLVRGTRLESPLPQYADNELLADRAQELEPEDDLGEDFSAEDANPRSELIPAAASRPKGRFTEVGLLSIFKSPKLGQMNSDFDMAYRYGLVE